MIKKYNYKVSEIIKLAGMKKSYNVESRKGIKLRKELLLTRFCKIAKSKFLPRVI